MTKMTGANKLCASCDCPDCQRVRAAEPELDQWDDEREWFVITGTPAAVKGFFQGVNAARGDYDAVARWFPRRRAWIYYRETAVSISSLFHSDAGDGLVSNKIQISRQSPPRLLDALAAATGITVRPSSADEEPQGRRRNDLPGTAAGIDSIVSRAVPQLRPVEDMPRGPILEVAELMKARVRL